MTYTVLASPISACLFGVIFPTLLWWRMGGFRYPVLSLLWHGVIAAAVTAILVLMPEAGWSQETRDEAKAEGKSLSSSLEGQFKSITKTPVTSDSVPGFETANPQETKYSDNPYALNSDGQAATLVDETAVFVDHTIRTGASVSNAELEDWVLNGRAVQKNASEVVRKYGGQYQDCKVEVIEPKETSFSYSCTEGPLVKTMPAACQVPLVVTVEKHYINTCRKRARKETWAGWEFCSYEMDDCEALDGYGCSTFTPVETLCGVQYSGPQARYCNFTCKKSNGTKTPLHEAKCTSPHPTRLVREETEITGETWNESACAAFTDDPAYEFQEEVCVEGPETRLINGEPVSRDCWHKERRYLQTVIGETVNTCEQPGGCTLTDTTCLSNHPVTGECLTKEHSYACTGQTSPGGAVGYCEEDVYCIEGDCEEIVREENTEFPQALSLLKTLETMAGDLTGDRLGVFPGEREHCSSKVLGIQNCCTNDGIATLIGFDCSAEDEALAKKQKAGLCHYVGTYCSEETLFGVCVTTRKAFCCFNSKLARIIHEQGRPQVSMGWGNPEGPNCAAFTIEIFQQLDLSQVDFSEFYADVIDDVNVPDPSALSETIIDKINATIGCGGDC